jgi:hypothetical protein
MKITAKESEATKWLARVQNSMPFCMESIHLGYYLVRLVHSSCTIVGLVHRQSDGTVNKRRYGTVIMVRTALGRRLGTSLIIVHRATLLDLSTCCLVLLMSEASNTS